MYCTQDGCDPVLDLRDMARTSELSHPRGHSSCLVSRGAAGPLTPGFLFDHTERCKLLRKRKFCVVEMSKKKDLKTFKVFLEGRGYLGGSWWFGRLFIISDSTMQNHPVDLEKTDFKRLGELSYSHF